MRVPDELAERIQADADACGVPMSTMAQMVVARAYGRTGSALFPATPGIDHEAFARLDADARRDVIALIKAQRGPAPVAGHLVEDPAFAAYIEREPRVRWDMGPDGRGIVGVLEAENDAIRAGVTSRGRQGGKGAAGVIVLPDDFDIDKVRAQLAQHVFDPPVVVRESDPCPCDCDPHLGRWHTQARPLTVPITKGSGGPVVGSGEVLQVPEGLGIVGKITDPSLSEALSPDLRGVSVERDWPQQVEDARSTPVHFFSTKDHGIWQLRDTSTGEPIAPKRVSPEDTSEPEADPSTPEQLLQTWDGANGWVKGREDSYRAPSLEHHDGDDLVVLSLHPEGLDLQTSTGSGWRHQLLTVDEARQILVNPPHRPGQTNPTADVPRETSGEDEQARERYLDRVAESLDVAREIVDGSEPDPAKLHMFRDRGDGSCEVCGEVRAGGRHPDLPEGPGDRDPWADPDGEVPEAGIVDGEVQVRHFPDPPPPTKGRDDGHRHRYDVPMDGHGVEYRKGVLFAIHRCRYCILTTAEPKKVRS
jgi:hypothetical protein